MTGKAKAKMRAVAIGAVALVLAVFALLLVPQARTRLDHLAFDTLQNLWPRPYVPVPVRIVDIDEDSLARLGQWPWPRHSLAALVENLRAAGAAAIALDIILAEPDRTAPARVSADWPLSPAMRQTIQTLPDPDAVLAAAIAGQPLLLTRRLITLLDVLMRSAGRVVSRPAIEARLYSIDDQIDSNALEASISRLRRILADKDSSVSIHTIRGVGYMLAEGDKS